MGDTSAAIAANRRRGLERMAEKLRAAGYTVVAPAGDADRTPRRVEFIEPAPNVASARGVTRGRSLGRLPATSR